MTLLLDKVPKHREWSQEPPAEVENKVPDLPDLLPDYVGHVPEAHAPLDRRQAGHEPVPQLEELLLPEVEVDEVVHRMLAEKKKIPGFGHRVYTTEDPRATHLRRMSSEAGQRVGNTKWYEMSAHMEKIVNEEKKLNANVDFYSASTYYTIGLPIDLFTPFFAVSRMAGWTAHVLEQYADNRLIRPRAEYIGPEPTLKWVPADQR